MGAALLLAGIVAAAITAPIFDRVFTRHLGLSLRLMIPVLSALWLSLIWAGKHSEPRIYRLGLIVIPSPAKQYCRSVCSHWVDRSLRHYHAPDIPRIGR